MIEDPKKAYVRRLSEAVEIGVLCNCRVSRLRADVERRNLGN